MAASACQAKVFSQRMIAELLTTFNVVATRALLALILLHFSVCTLAQDPSAKFIRLTTNEGLSQGHINAILKDHYGFMWFATEGGLNKYDGYRFTVYTHDQENPASISSSVVTDLLEDTGGNLWVGTRGGIDKFNRLKDEFIHYRLGKGVVNSIYEDRKKMIWVGTSEGVFVIDQVNGTIKQYKHNLNNPNSLSDDFVYEVIEDNNGEIWIATKDGLNRLNLSTHTFHCYQNNPLNKETISANWVRTVYEDVNNNIWVGTKGGGVGLYNRKSNSFINYRKDIYKSNSVCHNDILSFCEDDKGYLWIGTENGGISVFNQKANTFINYKNDPYNVNSLSNNSIYSLYKDNLGAMWVGTYSEGINFMPKNAGKFAHYNQNLSDKNSLNDHTVLSMTGDNEGNLWIGTDGGGLNRFNKRTKTFTHYVNDLSNKNSINSNYVISVVQIGESLLGLGLYGGGFDILNTKTGKFTHNMPVKGNAQSISSPSIFVVRKSYTGKVWLGTFGRGVDLYDPRQKTFRHFANDPADENSIGFNFITCMLEDRDGNLWVGSADGLDMLDKATGKFIHYRHSEKDKKSLIQNFVQSIFEDRANNLWFGTSAGLCLFDKKTKTFTTYSEKDGLANNMIQSIIEDNAGNLWIGSNAGLTKFNPKTKACKNYNSSDGLQGREFKPSSCYKDADGQLFFGGTNGFNAFYPDRLKFNAFIPPVFITDFQVFNKQVKPGGKEAPINEQINYAKEITLSYKQSVFSFEFAALNYYLPGNNQYAYKLEGFDKEWTYAGAKRTATYTNLDPGQYIFRVKGSNNDGVWNEKGSAVSITILPPFWMTWWFRLGGILIIIAGAIGYYGFRVNVIETQKIYLEEKVKEQTAQLLTSTAQLISSNEEERKARQEADEANRAKSVFLATMSHEIRTPMNGVIGMASLLMQTNLSEEQKSYAKTIATSGQSLLSVINGILDFSKIESGKMELENKTFDLQTCITEALEIFYVTAAESTIKLGYKIDQDVPAHIIGDSLRVRQILINLVGNAMKFTKANGEVFVSVHLLDKGENDLLHVGFKVRDTGVGIPADKLSRLFKAFSQVDSSTTRKHGGTGLGLVICDKLVAMMGGNIQVESQPDKGTTFTFSIQTTAADQPVDSKQEDNIYGLPGRNGKGRNVDEQKLSADFASLHPLRILIAEDNAINMLIAKNILGKLGYRPSGVENGREVLDLLKREDFDVILMDVQMPEMDGLDATKMIRKQNNEQPVIIAMTANAMQGDKDECIKAGMDDYLSKPISLDVLVNMLEKWAKHVRIVQNN
jgi:signal transduction histidine kinase/ligand-binding sensor domain-containing protein/ActR/RegA family two-component response regulator